MSGKDCQEKPKINVRNMESNFPKQIQDVLLFSQEEAIRLGNDYIGPEHFFLGILRESQPLKVSTLHLLLAILKDETCMVTQILEDMNVNYSLVKQPIKNDPPISKADYHDEDEETDSPSDP